MDAPDAGQADLVPLTLTADPSALQSAVAEHRSSLEARALAPRTRTAYQKDLRHFSDWLGSHGIDITNLDTPARAETALLVYLDVHLYHADPTRRLLPSTMERRLSGLRHQFKVRNIPWPGDDEHLRLAVKVARRELGRPPQRAAPISVSLLRQMVSSCPRSPKGLRDRALLLVGFCAGLRRSELVSMDWQDVDFEPEGARLLLPRSKSDQVASGRQIYLPLGRHADTCPVSALRSWRQLPPSRERPVFTSVSRSGTISDSRLTPDVVDRLVRHYAFLAQPGARYSAHSLRAGLATAAAQAGADDRTIMATTGHRSRSTLDDYVRVGRGYANSVMSFLDL